VGADPRGLRETARTLKVLEPGARIQLVKAPFFTSGNWESEVDVVVFPGGRDLPYVEALAGEGCRRIRDFVLAGGKYFGICAGAYFGSQYIEFEKGEPLEVCGHRELGLYPGKAIGPLFEKNVFRYNSLEGARATSIQWGVKTFQVFYHGGCTFEEVEHHEQVNVLARYAELEGEPPAVILSKVGKGKALLSGVHPEYSPSSCHKLPFAGELFSSEGTRLPFLHNLWSLLIKD